MAVTAATLRRIAGMSPEAMVEMLLILADQEQVDEERKAGQRERTRRHRDRNVTVTDMSRDCNVTPPSKEKSPKPPKETQPPPVSANADTPARDFFEEFWAIYPRRDGDNPKKPARLKFDRAVAKGADPDAIIAGARALARQHPSPTPFVPQAVTWINQERWADTINGHGHDPPVSRIRTSEEIFAEMDAEEAANGKGQREAEGHPEDLRDDRSGSSRTELRSESRH